jgi:hypothetical protein
VILQCIPERRAATAVAGAFLSVALATSPSTAAVIADPATAVETWVRLKGDTSGAVTYEWVRGTAYGLPAEEPGRPLFDIESVTVRQVRRMGPAHYVEQNYACRLYRDPQSGQYIARMLNPYTGREVELTARCSAGPAVRYTAERVSLIGNIRFESSALGAPLRLERLDAGDQVVLRREAHSQYRSQASGELRRETSIDTFTVNAAALGDATVTSLPAAYQWTSVTQWMADLGMGATPGRMLWSINGRKFAQADQLPAEFRAQLERAVPGALERSFDWKSF